MNDKSNRFKELDRALHQLYNIASSKDVEVDKDTIESAVTTLFRRATRNSLESRAAAEKCCSRLFHGSSGPTPSLLDILQLQDTGLRKTYATLLAFTLEHLVTFLKDMHDTFRQSLASHVETLVLTCCNVLTSSQMASKCRSEAGYLVKYSVKHYAPPSASFQLPRLIGRLLDELKSSKCTQTVKGVILELLGALLQKYPQEMDSSRENIRSWIEAALDKQFASNSPELQIINGSFTCLAEIITANTYDEGFRDKLFKYMHVTLATATSGNLSRLAIVKSCLLLLGRHIQVFSENIVRSDTYQFYSMLLFCCTSSNKKVRKPAFSCLDGAFDIIAQGLVCDVAQNKKLFNKFLKEFLSCLTEKMSDDKVSIALAGLGSFAAIIPVFMGDGALSKIHTRLVKYGEDVMAMREKMKFKWMLLCRFTTCYGHFVRNMQSNEAAVENFAVTLACRILEAYPSSAIYVKYQAEISLVSIFQALPTGNAIDRVIRHGILLTVSTQLNPSQEETLYHPDTGLPEPRLLFEYEILWRNLLKRLKDQKNHGKIIDVFMKSILEVFERLDLRYKQKENKTEEDASEFEPLISRDQTIALNLTEFCERWLPSVQSSIQPWIPLFLKWIFSRSRESPLVSVLYRLATVVSRILAIEVSIPPAVQDEYIDFILGVVNAMKAYSNELLVSTSIFVLASPLSMVDVKMLIPALKQALSLGTSHNDTAVAAVSALENWHQVQPNALKQFYQELLPLFAPYLSTSNEGLTVQLKLLKILGSMGGYSRYVVQEEDPQLQISAPLDISLAMENVHVEIPISNILHQMKDLALTSIDRGIKSAAAEGYHAMVLYLCGKTATLPRSKSSANEKSIYYDHWANVFPSLVMLASDADTITRSLFAPLLSQLLRWFSGISSMYPFEAQIFLDSLIDGISSADDGGAREVCALSLSTFLKYASKQPGSTSFSAHTLFERLFALSSHPVRSCRLGIALAVNQFYRDFREDQEMVDIYAMSILKYLLLAIKSEGSDSALSLHHAVDHMEKIILKSAPTLQHENPDRTILGGSECLNLESFTSWLFSNIANASPDFRNRCLKLFVTLSRMVGMTGSCKEWLKQYQKSHTVGQLIDVLAPQELISLYFIEGMKNVWYETLAASTECYTWACSITLGNSSLIDENVLLDPSASMKRLLSTNADVQNSHRVFVAAKHFFANVDEPTQARNRAFEGVCKLVTLAINSETSLPLLSKQVDQSGLVDNNFLEFVVQARIEPGRVGLKEFSDTQVWMNLCQSLLRRQNLLFRNVLLQVLSNSPYRRENLFDMDSNLVQWICATYSELHKINFWSHDQQEDIANDFANMAISERKNNTRSPIRDQIARTAMQTAIEMGWDLASFILKSTDENYDLFASTFDSSLHKSSIWLNVAVGFMSNIENYESCALNTFQRVLEANPKSSDGLAPYVNDFAKYALSTAAKDQSSLLKILDQVFNNFQDVKSLALFDCALGIKQVLCDKSKAASLKVDAMHLIPHMLKFSPDCTEIMTEGIAHLVVHDFPVNSNDITKGTVAFDAFEMLFQSYLFVLVKSSQIGLLKTLFQSLKEKKSHAFYSAIQDALESFALEVPMCRIYPVCLELLQLLFDFGLDDYIRTMLHRQVFSRLVHQLEEADIIKLFTMTSFGVPFVKYLMNIVLNDLSPLISLVMAFGSLELLYSCLSGDAIRHSVNPVYADAPAKGNELTVRLCKAASQKSANPENSCAVAAYRCLLVTVRKTQTQEKFYTQLLFADQIWPKIVDQSQEYIFETETTSFPTKYLSDARKRIQLRQFQRMDISSQFLAGSSLSQSSEGEQLSSNPTSEETEDEVLELDILNMHPCMIPLMQTIKHMETLFHSQWSNIAMPGWIEKVWFNLSSHSSTATRIFLCKLVLNRPGIFEPYAAKFVGPIVELIVEVPKLDEFHYILRDICHLVVDTWHLETIDYDLSQFVKHLIAVSPNTSAAILRDNLYLIESFLFRYPSQCRFLNGDAIMDMIGGDGNDKLDTARHVAGMQIVAMLLSLAFDATSPATSFEFLLRNARAKLENNLLTRMVSMHKTTPILAADIAGLVLKHMHSTTFQTSVETQLALFFQEEKPDRFLTCVKQVSFHYPPIVDESTLNRLMSIFPRIWVQDTLLLCTLDIVYSSNFQAAEIFRFLRPHLPRLLRHNNPDVPLRLIDVMTKLWPNLSEDYQMVLLSGDCSVLFAFENESCQMKVLQFVISIDKLSVPAVQLISLKALSSKIADVRERAYEFWEKQLPSSCDDRLLALFGPLYHDQTTEDWVKYAPKLWLSLCQASSDNKQFLFSEPLSSSANFEQLAIDTSWEHRTQNILTPLFSQDAQALQSQSAIFEGGFVKATQDPIWSQTQAQHFTQSQVESSAPNSSSHRRDITAKRFTKHSGNEPGNQENRTKSYFQDQASRSKKLEIARIKQAKSKGSKVSLYRAYRVGEFPDIQIPRMDIFRPLLAVVASHTATATSLFSIILSTVLPNLSASTQSQVITKIEALLQQSQHNTFFVASLHQAYLSLLRHPSTLLLAPDIVGISSIASRNFTTGQRILEEIIIRAADSRIVSMAWNQLLHILQMVQNEPYMMALSAETCVLSETNLALHAQLSGDLVAAIQHYKDAEAKFKLLDKSQDISLLEQQRWKSEQYNCLATLNRWDKVLEEVESLDLWQQNEPFLANHMGYFLEASMALNDNDRLKSFFGSINNQSDKQRYLNSRFPDILAAIYLQCQQTSDAQAAVEDFYQTCLNQWSSMPTAHQKRQLERLPNAVFLDEVLNTVRNASSIESCILKWKSITPLVQADTLKTWSSYYLIRNLGYDVLTAHSQGQAKGDDSIIREVMAARVHAMLSYAEAAVESNVLALAGRLLTEYRTLCDENSLPKLSVHMVKVYASQVSKLASQKLQAASGLHGNDRARVISQVTNYYTALTRLIENDEVLELISTMPPDAQAEICGWQARGLMESSDFQREYGDPSTSVKLSSAALEIFQYQTSKATNVTTMHLTYIEYLDKIIERTPSSTDLVNQFVTTVLWGMSMADKGCSAYFPRVLGLLREHPTLINMAQEKLKQIPLWTCLHWSAQVMALMSEKPSPFNDFILTLLEMMAAEYPRALYYDFRLSQESIIDIETNPRFHRLSAALRDVHLDQFVAALHGLHHPEIRLKEALRYLSDVVESKPAKEASKIIAATISHVLDESSKILGNQIGVYNRQWITKNRKQIESMLGKQGELANKSTLQTAKGWLSQSFQVMPGKYGIDRQWKAKLSDFSDWLMQLDPVKTRIELPGQYIKRWAKPDPSTHTYILSCDPQLMVLPSKQLPKRLKLYASDEKTYLFLVKGGEDLRLDQRIEQLFGVMNTILQQSNQCSRRHLNTRTYNVIPMTTKIGLVEWLENTTTLKSIVEQEMSTTKKSNLLQSPPGQLYENFWSKQRGKTYGQKIATASSSAVTLVYSQAQEMVPMDLIRRHLVNMAQTPAAFFQLRETFSTSLAAFNGCSYILGIGDRHLDNFLLDYITGTVVGIDFGISFGSGASMLPVPELVPFRFTRQLQGVLQPHNAKLLFQQDLAAVLEALRGQHQRIESVMSVFLNEPLLEWQVTVKKKSRRDKDQKDENASSSWLPELKMQLAQRKLRGEHVVHILREELQLNPHIASVYSHFDQIIPVPSDVPKHGFLSPLDQAKALIDIATDANVLGRMFHGWSSWA
ncbi:hypothetical protein AeMF1_000010 [Aphanomyces euteiches]|nr:hypothetical protein AeMF1_000010 [Aphanomyces euteiches]